jgi:hypothetical protein
MIILVGRNLVSSIMPKPEKAPIGEIMSDEKKGKAEMPE